MRVQVSKEGARVVLAIRTADGASATLDVHPSGMGALAANLRDTADSAEDCDREFELRGTLTTCAPTHHRRTG